MQLYARIPSSIAVTPDLSGKSVCPNRTCQEISPRRSGFCLLDRELSGQIQFFAGLAQIGLVVADYCNENVREKHPPDG